MPDEHTMTPRELLEHIVATASGQAANAGTIAAAALLIREGLDNLDAALREDPRTVAAQAARAADMAPPR